MLLDIPAVASTEGVVTPTPWASHGTYGYDRDMWLPGRYVSGTFTDNEELDQLPLVSQAFVSGAGQTAGSKWLVVDDLSGVTDDNREWVGQTSGAKFLQQGPGRISPHFFIHITHPSGSTFLLPQTDAYYRLVGVTTATGGNSMQLSDQARAMVPQGSTVKFLECVAPTFQIPIWARGGTVYNRSGADMFLRNYRPNVEGNVIDTTAATFGENAIVGIPIGDGGYYSFDPGGFAAGTSWMLCAASAAVGGAVVEFNP